MQSRFFTFFIKEISCFLARAVVDIKIALCVNKTRTLSLSTKHGEHENGKCSHSVITHPVCTCPRQPVMRPVERIKEEQRSGPRKVKIKGVRHLFLNHANARPSKLYCLEQFPKINQPVLVSDCPAFDGHFKIQRPVQHLHPLQGDTSPITSQFLFQLTTKGQYLFPK